MADEPKARGHLIFEFHDDTGEPNFKLPQCHDGKLVTRYYEFYRSDDPDMLKGECYAARLLCEECLEKALNDAQQK